MTDLSFARTSDYSSRNDESFNEPAKQAKGCSPGWSERSERDPGYATQQDNKARFSGRQKFVLIAAGLLLLVTFAGCAGNNQPDSAAASPSASPTPTRVSSSDQVVKLSTAPVTIAPNGSGEAVVSLSIAKGFHINANPASFAYLIATEIQPGKLEGITTNKPTYPASVNKTFEFSPKPLAVYEGDVSIKVPLKATSLAAGSHSLPFKLHVQACDHEKCYSPIFIDGAIAITTN